MAETKRKNELSLMNVVLCLFVIFIHAASGFVTAADKSTWQFAVVFAVQRCCACAVPGFFFLAALKISLSAEKEFHYGRYLFGRLKRVLLPYIICAVLYYTYFVVRKFYTFQPAEFAKMLLDGSMCAHFYFIIAVMQFYLLTPLWRWFARKLDRPEWAVGVLVLALPIGQIFGQYLADYIHVFNPAYYFPYCDRVFTTYLFWWMLGLVFGRNYERVKEMAKRSFLPILGLFLFAAAHEVYLGWVHNTGKMSIWWLETVHVVYVIGAILFLFSLSVKLSETKLASFPLVRLIDRTSFSIYLWHPLTLYIADGITSNIPGATMLVGFLMRILLAFGGTIAVCIGVHLAIGALGKLVKKKKTA